MKIFILSAAITCSIFISCNHQAKKEKKAAAASTAVKLKDVTKRDRSITVDNAYNNLFLDSAAVSAFVQSRQLPDSISRRVRSFYNARNYEYAWLSTSGLTEQALGFWNLHTYATYAGDTSLKDKSLQKTMAHLLGDTGIIIKAADKNMALTEMLLTQHFIEYSLHHFEKGFVKRKELERFIPAKKEDAMMLSDSLLEHKHKDNKYFDDVNESYKRLKKELASYYQLAKTGGWQPLAMDAKKYQTGSKAEGIILLKKRLAITADMPATDTSHVFTDTLLEGIKHVQQRFGYKPDGKVTAVLIKDLNVPVSYRLKQILINMNRMRWMPQEPAGKLILVNIPEFVLHFVDGKNKIFDMKVVVGKEGHNTMMFTGKLSTIVFSPYWGVPQSIVKKEILPHLAKNPNYLAQQEMEITGKDADGIPRVRQKPGQKNSLGKVKFLFPNNFDIYFHDTHAKSLFSNDKRAYSHGCIRLSDPLKMAEYLLKDDPKWPVDKIVAAMDSTGELYVKVKNAVPVFITYYTAWVDEDNQLNFRDDIYRRDRAVATKMFQ